MKNNKIKNNKGQIAIIVLLASAIILTLGLSASKSTTTNIKINNDEESLKTAFNTAESAINNYLTDNSKTNYSVAGSGATIVSTSIGGENTKSISSEGQVPANSTQLFWLVNHNSDGSIGSNYYTSSSVKLCVANSSFDGALKIDFFYRNGDAYGIKRWGYNFGGGSVVNGFNSNNSSCIDAVDLSAGSPLLISITPLGSATSLTISGSADFPVQGEEIAAASSTDNGVKTQIKTRYIYQIPPFMLDAITVKNIIQ